MVKVEIKRTGKAYAISYGVDGVKQLPKRTWESDPRARARAEAEYRRMLKSADV